MIYLAVLFAIAIFLLANNRLIVCSRHTILTEKAAGRILHLSDLHSCRFTRRLYQKIQREQPSLILITGDLWDRRKRDIPRMVDFAASLSAICPVGYVPGNHEFHDPEHEQIFLQMEKRGIHVLRHRTECFSEFAVLGMDWMCYGAFSPQELSRLSRRPEYRIAAVHYPEFFETLYADYDIDLVLCGHAHGGQFRIPFLKKGIYSPDQGLFPRYSEGLHEQNGVKMIVSRGIGNSRFPFRLWNPPEIVVIDLKRSIA